MWSSGPVVRTISSPLLMADTALGDVSDVDTTAGQTVVMSFAAEHARVVPLD